MRARERKRDIETERKGERKRERRGEKGRERLRYLNCPVLSLLS